MFFDLQINGCFGVDFNSESLTREQWDIATSRLAADGTRYYLPTIITDAPELMIAKIDRIATWIGEQKRQTELISTSGISLVSDSINQRETSQAVGIHLEGPFISREPGYIGAHPVEHARASELDLAKQLIEAGNGLVRMVTLAPEQDPSGDVTRYLSSQGICVAAGHTNASRDQLLKAIDHGLRLFTHLGNGCPAILPRHDNILTRVLSLHDQLQVSLIADGHHLPLWLLSCWIEWFGVDRVSIVSDAISAAGLAPGLHTLGRRTVLVGDDGVPRSEDKTHFVGSGATLGKMNSALISQTQLAADDRQKILFDNALKLVSSVHVERIS